MGIKKLNNDTIKIEVQYHVKESKSIVSTVIKMDRVISITNNENTTLVNMLGGYKLIIAYADYGYMFSSSQNFETLRFYERMECRNQEEYEQLKNELEKIYTDYKSDMTIADLANQRI